MPRIGQVSSANVDAAIAAHAADEDAHHTKYTDTEALAAAIAGGLSKVVWKDASETALTDLNRTATLDYTDLDLTAYTSAKAKFAIVDILFICDIMDATGDSFAIYIRKNGTAETATQIMRADYDAGMRDTGQLRRTKIIGLDSGQVMEYKLLVGGTVQVDTYITVIGYIE